jgi:hypothetical protein
MNSFAFMQSLDSFARQCVALQPVQTQPVATQAVQCEQNPSQAGGVGKLRVAATSRAILIVGSLRNRVINYVPARTLRRSFAFMQSFEGFELLI